ncbi:MAG: holo-ACP synthase [Spirochaetes bacterium]|nr:holo-ACP synthase [Spirochaetota bacterium]
MIAGLGIDIVHVGRIQRWLAIPGLVERFFHPIEISTSASRGAGMSLSLAARFAAKEAFGKALGTGLADIHLKDILVRNDHRGKPEIFLEGTALARFKALGGGKLHCSLTHEGENAVAIVIIEREGRVR